MGKLINFFLNGGDKEFIVPTRYDAIWANSRQKHKLAFNKTSLKLAINYLLNIHYFTLGSMGFGQLILNLIGTYPPPLLANSFLNCYERSGIFKQERDLRKTQIFSNIFRFKDDV